MRFSGNALRRAAAAAAMAVTATAAGCAGATPADPVPPVFAASLPPAKPGRGLGDRLGLLSSRTGHLLRWLAAQPHGASDGVLSVRDGWVYFVRYPADPSTRSPAIWRVRVSGGRAQLVQAGAGDYAVSPDGHAVAYVTSADHGDVVEVAVRNLVTGRRNTIVMATKPSPGANNWPPGVYGLTWARDDVHLAVQFQLTAAINSVLVFDAFTAAAIRDGRAAPVPCPAAYQCQGLDPAYLASGALSYVIQRLSRSGSASDSLVSWRAGHPAITLLSLPAGMQAQVYDMTAQGQAIWVGGPARPKGPWTIWRWSGGAPVKITTLPPLGASPYYGVGAVAW